MTKQAFLNELSSQLSPLNENLRAEICNEFADHFTEGAERGMDEDEICRNLGQPSSIAEQYVAEYKNAAAKGVPFPAVEIPPVNAYGGETPAFNAPPAPSVPPAPTPPAEGPKDYVFAFGQPPREIDIVKSFNDIANIRVELKYSNLTIEPAGPAEPVSVSIRGRSRHDRFIVENYGGQLQVIENTLHFPFEFILYRSIKLDTVVRVPEGFVGNIDVKVSSGFTNVNGVRGGNLKVKNTSKNVRVENCGFHGFEVDVTAGSLDFINCGSDTIRLHVTAGNARVENTTGQLDAKNTAGNLTITRHLGKLLKAHASAGNLTISDCDADINAHSSAGEVHISCEGRVLHNVYAHSSAGSVKLYAEETRSLDAHSSAGDVKIIVRKVWGDINLKSSAGNVRAEIWELEGNITAHSSTGNVHLYLPDPVNCRIEASSRMGSLKQRIQGIPSAPYQLRATASMGNVVLDDIHGRK